MKVVFRTNLGLDDARTVGLVGQKPTDEEAKKFRECRAGATVDVGSKGIAEALIDKGIALSVDDAQSDPVVLSAQGVPDEQVAGIDGLSAPSPVRGVSAEAAVSPVHDATAADAIVQISAMRSKEKLQAIIDADQRTTVVDAAKKRLGEV